MKIERTVSEPLRHGLSTAQAWQGPDFGLIACWERGREMSKQDVQLAERAAQGELVPLPWKGGVDKKLKVKLKFGTLRYLAMWQGLRGENLNIETNAEPLLCCTKHGQSVLFTDDCDKYGDA